MPDGEIKLLEYRAAIQQNREIFLLQRAYAFHAFAGVMDYFDSIGQRTQIGRDVNGKSHVGLIPFILLAQRQAMNAFEVLSTDLMMLGCPSVQLLNVCSCVVSGLMIPVMLNFGSPEKHVRVNTHKPSLVKGSGLRVYPDQMNCSLYCLHLMTCLYTLTMNTITDTQALSQQKRITLI